MSIAQDLHEARVTDLDLTEFTTVPAGTSIRAVIDQMKTAGTNCAFIIQDGALAGIFTDRDILQGVVDHPETWDHDISEVMTRDPHTIQSDQTAGDALALMESLHFRNIPVLKPDGAIAGNLTHFALIRYLAEHFPEEVLNLPPEPDNFGDERHGG